MAGSNYGGFLGQYENTATGGGSFIPDYPQAPFLTEVAQYAKQLSEQLYNWGQTEFANIKAITDANIAQYQQASAQALGLATNNIARYEQLFQPQEDALIADANSYASKERQALEMGQAQAQTGMAMEAGRKNALRDLQSYGIDPSAGRYAGLDRAERAQAAAAQAGAGQVARQRTEDTGRALRDRAIQVGQQYPGQAVNALNMAVSGIAGAQNAALGAANTGVNLYNPALGFLNNAASLKYPPLGTNPKTGASGGSVSGGSGSNKSPSGGPGGSPFGPGGPGGGPGSGMGAWDPYAASKVGGKPGVGSPGGPGIYPVGPFPQSDPYGGYQPDFAGDYSGYDYQEPYQDYGGPSSFDEAGFDYDYGGASSFDETGFDYDYGGVQDYGGYDYDPQSYAGPSQDYGGYDYDPQSYDGGGTSYDEYGGYEEYYARGGPVAGQRLRPQRPQRGIPSGGTPGGQVPRQASPSQGQRVDDVNANLTVDEFVVPRDVALWKGQEFFQKLIAQSRKARMTAPAQGGQPGPSSPGPAQFASQAVG